MGQLILWNLIPSCPNTKAYVKGFGCFLLLKVALLLNTNLYNDLFPDSQLVTFFISNVLCYFCINLSSIWDRK